MVEPFSRLGVKWRKKTGAKNNAVDSSLMKHDNFQYSKHANFLVGNTSIFSIHRFGQVEFFI